LGKHRVLLSEMQFAEGRPNTSRGEYDPIESTNQASIKPNFGG